MHGMIKGEHKRKLTKAEKQLDRSAQYFNLLLFSSSDSVLDDTRQVPLQVTPTAATTSATKYRGISTSPITVPGTPDNSHPTEPKRQKRFPHPNYDHRNTNYKQPPLTDRLSLDDIFDGCPKESLSPIPPKGRIMTEYRFDFSPEGFPHELYRVRGANMVREYNQRKGQTSAHQSDDENSDDSTNSLTIYEQAYACFRPEPGESNAESAERHRLIEERVTELKQARRRKIKPAPSTKHQQQLETTNKQQRRKTVRTKKDIKKQLKRPPIESSTPSLTNNTQSYTFEEAVTQIPHTRTITRQINVIMDTGATFTMLPGDYDFAWTNRSPCLHIIEGCLLQGRRNKQGHRNG